MRETRDDCNDYLGTFFKPLERHVFGDFFNVNVHWYSNIRTCLILSRVFFKSFNGFFFKVLMVLLVLDVVVHRQK